MYVIYLCMSYTYVCHILMYVIYLCMSYTSSSCCYFVLVHVRILQILLDFPHATAKIPFEYLFDLIPPMQPRAMSIASSSLVSLPKDSG